MEKMVYKTLRENVLSAIREKIVRGELTPGMRIVEQNLAAEFGTSRGPIREALRQLEQEGMVEYIPNAGCSVRRITAEDVYEIYLMQASYEIMSLRCCEEPFTEEELAELGVILGQMQQLPPGDLDGIIACDHRFHAVFVRKSGLKRIWSAWESLSYGSFLASANTGTHGAELAEKQYRIHKALLDACRTGDTEAICWAIYRHYMRPVKRLLSECELSPRNVRFSQQLLDDPEITY